MSSGNGGHPGQRASDGLSRIGQVVNAPSIAPGGGGGGVGGFGWGGILDFFRDIGGASAPTPPSHGAAPGGPDDAAPKKLPDLAGDASPQDWESLDPIPARSAGNCPDGGNDLGVVLFVHDVEDKRRDFATRSDADRWQAVHTISDLIEALRNLVGECDCVRGIMISAHGGWGNHGGFRMGDDDDDDGVIEGTEANDMVSTAAQARKFGDLIKGAFCDGDDTFIAVEACSSSGPGNAFIDALHDATGMITIGSVGSANVGGNWWSGDWWTADDGRSQINRDGSTTTDAADEGDGVWRPF